jgi:hypothetical protein
MKDAVFWDVTPCGSCKNRRFEGTYGFHNQCDKNRRARNNIAVTSNRRTLRRNTVNCEGIIYGLVEGTNSALTGRIPSQAAKKLLYRLN